MAEVIGAGCARFFDGQVPREAPPVCNEDNACICCRVFGFVDGDFAWAGKVRFRDATAQTVRWTGLQLTTDRPAHETHPGWVLFRHTPVNLGRGTTRCVEAGARFTFAVEFLNLEEEERAVLQFALTLRHDSPARGHIDLCHKLGYGKSLGLGGCTVRIARPVPTPAIGEEIESYLADESFGSVRDAREQFHR